MSETKHSTLPWHTGGIFNPTSPHPTMNIWTEPLPGNSSGDIVAERVPLNDAAFIVLATSLHHELVAALSKAILHLRFAQSGFTTPEIDNDWLNKRDQMAVIALTIGLYKSWEHVRPILIDMCNAGFGGCQ